MIPLPLRRTVFHCAVFCALIGLECSSIVRAERISGTGQTAPRDGRRAKRHDPDIWLVNTRQLERPRGQTRWNRQPVVWQYRDGGYRFSTLNDLLDSHDPNELTCIYVHGNRQSPDDASGQGLVMYDRFVDPEHPCRFIVWSWPSKNMTGRPYRDAAYRADSESLYLATLLAGLPPHSNVTLIGYSYGARTVSGSLHLLAGGRLDGNCLPQQDERVHPRAVLLSAAFPGYWWMPNQRHGLTLQHTPQIVLFYNRADPALRSFSLVFADEGHPVPLGRSGIAATALGTLSDRLIQFDATQIAGKSHSLYRMTDSDRIIELIRNTSMH